MEFDKPITIKVLRRDISRLHRLVEELMIRSESPEGDEMNDILRKILKLDEKRHETTD